MPGGVIIRPDYAALFLDRLAYIDHLMAEKVKAWPEEYGVIFRKMTSKRAKEQVTGTSGLGTFFPMPEGTALQYDKPLALPTKEYTHVDYGLGTEYSPQAQRDDVDGTIKRLAPKLMRSGLVTVEQSGIGVMTLGFAAQPGDPRNEALFATNHALAGGGTASNLLSPQADPSVTSMQSVMQLLEDCVDDRGMPMMMKAELVLCGTSLSWIFEYLVNSPDHPETAERSVNPLNRNKVQYAVNHYLTSQTFWAMRTAKDETEMNFYWRVPFTSDHTVDFETKSGKTSLMGAFSYGWADWRGWAAGRS
jgi:hypothetical protein